MVNPHTENEKDDVGSQIQLKPKAHFTLPVPLLRTWKHTEQKASRWLVPCWDCHNLCLNYSPAQKSYLHPQDTMVLPLSGCICDWGCLIWSCSAGPVLAAESSRAERRLQVILEKSNCPPRSQTAEAQGLCEQPGFQLCVSHVVLLESGRCGWGKRFPHAHRSFPKKCLYKYFSKKLVWPT